MKSLEAPRRLLCPDAGHHPGNPPCRSRGELTQLATSSIINVVFYVLRVVFTTKSGDWLPLSLLDSTVARRLAPIRIATMTETSLVQSRIALDGWPITEGPFREPLAALRASRGSRLCNDTQKGGHSPKASTAQEHARRSSPLSMMIFPSQLHH